MKLSVFVLLFCYSFILPADTARHELELRIAPVGTVTVQEQIPEKTADVSPKNERGHDIYTQYCIVCHGEGLAGAPRFRNQQEWQSHLVDKKLDDLLASSIKGLNAMPSKGTCVKCSDDDLRAAISYMLPRS